MWTEFFPTRRVLGRLLKLLWVPFCLFQVSACVHRPLGLDHRADALERTLASPAETGDDLLARGWARLIGTCDWRLAIADLGAAAKSIAPEQGPKRQLARLGQALGALGSADFPLALEGFMAAVEIDPQSGEALVAALQLSETAAQIDGGHAGLAGRVEALLAARPAPHPEVTRVLEEFLRKGALRAGRWELAREWERKLGIPPLWRVQGGYGGHPLIAMATPFAPESEALPDSATWISPEGGTLFLDSEKADTIHYAETYFRIEASADLHLRLAGPGSWAAFVDDQPLLVHDLARAYGPTVERASFKGAPGWHRLLLKLPFDQGQAELRVELTSLDGSGALITWLDRDTPRPALGRIALGPNKPGLASALARQVDDRPHDAAVALLAALVAWDENDTIAARRLIRVAKARADTSFALADYLLALLAMEDPDTPPGLDSVRARDFINQSLSTCPQFPLARFRRAILDGEEDQQEQALADLADLDGASPHSFLWPYYRGRIMEKLGWKQEAERSYRLALRRMPDNIDVLRKLHELDSENGNLASRQQLAQRLWDLGQWEEGQAELWRLGGDTARAQQALEQIIARFPFRLSARLALADLLVAAGHLARADQALAKAAALAPDRIEIVNRQADLLDRQGQLEQGQALRRQMARQHPWYLPVRRALAAQRGQEVIGVAGAPIEDGPTLIQAHKASGHRANGNAALIYDQASQEIAADGTSIERVHTIVQVLSPEGMERWGEIDILPSDAEIERLRTIGADGRIHEAEVIPGKDSITLPALSLGDFIEIAYVHGQRASDILARAFLSRGFLFQALAAPILRSHYSVAVPQGTDLVVDLHHDAPAPNHKAVDGFDVYSFERLGSPGLPPEPHAPPLHELVPMVQVGFGASWSDLRNLLREELRLATRTTPALMEYAQQALGQASERGERIRRLFAAVTRDIHQQGEGPDLGQPAAHILARREGNRLVLLSALLAATGIEHRVLLARTVAHAQTEYKLPTVVGYSHGLIRIEATGPGQGPIFLDPNERYNPTGQLFPFLAGMKAMDITASGQAPIFVSLPERSGWELEKRIDLDLELLTDGTLFGRGLERITTAQAVHYRALLAAMGPDQRRKALEAGLGGYFSGALLSESKIAALEDPAQALEISYRFRAPAFALPRKDTLILRGGFYPYQLAANLISSNIRQNPLLITDRTNSHTHIVVKLPQGARAEAPEAVDWTAPLSRFRMTVSQEGRMLIIDKWLTVDPGRILPGDYPAFRDFCHRVDAQETDGLVIDLAGAVRTTAAR